MRIVGVKLRNSWGPGEREYSKKGEGEGEEGGDRGEEGTYQLEIGGTTLLGGGWGGKELELGGGIILLLFIYLFIIIIVKNWNWVVV